MVQKHKYQAYAAATQTVAKTKQIVMLYDGAIRFLQQAKEAAAAKRIEERYRLLTKASNIISGLQGCLDFENGGSIAKVLYNFYSSVESRIFSIHRSGDPQACEEVIADLKEMREVWHEIDRSGASEKEEAQAAPAPAEEATASAPALTDLPQITLSA